MPGHLEKKSKSSWTIVIELGRDPETGKRKRLYRSFRGTKREAEIEMAKLISEYDKGLLLDTKITFGEYLQKWLEDYCKVRLSPNYIQTLFSDIKPKGYSQIGSHPFRKIEAASFADIL